MYSASLLSDTNGHRKSFVKSEWAAAVQSAGPKQQLFV